jgi:RNA polymerase sigma factor (sigma-70 family)
MTQTDFVQLYETYHSDIVNYARSYCECPEDIQDIASETFTKVFENIGNINHPVAYLYATAHNTIIDHINTSHKYINTDTDNPIFEAHECDPHDYECLHKAIKTLKPLQSATLYLYYWKKMKQHDIANTLGLTTKAVEHHIARAKQRLRSEIGENRQT